MTTWPTVSCVRRGSSTHKIKQGLDAAEADIKRAHNVRAWQALGYPNWDIYCKTEFGLCMLRVPMEKRVEMVRSLEMHGLTYAEIGSAMGTSAATAWRDAKKRAPFQMKRDHRNRSRGRDPTRSSSIKHARRSPTARSKSSDCAKTGSISTATRS